MWVALLVAAVIPIPLLARCGGPLVSRLVVLAWVVAYLGMVVSWLTFVWR